MKRKFTLVGSAILAVAFVNILVIGCSDDGDNRNGSGYLKRLSGTWHIEHVTLRGADVTHLFEDVVLTINTDRTYSVLNGMPPLWPHGGSFTLVEADQTENGYIIRDDGMEMLVSALSGESLQLNFLYDAPASGRVSSVSGGYEFVFQRQ